MDPALVEAATERNEKHFESVSAKKFILERRVELEPGEAPEFQAELRRRRWGTLGSYPLPANIAVVKEFYANALRLEEGIAPFVSYVRGVRVPYDAQTINQFLGTTLRADEESEYNNYTTETMDPALVEVAICVPGRGFHKNRSQLPLHVKRRDLLPVVRIWSALVHANILPCSHVSDLHWSRSMLMYCIMTQRTVDLGGIICIEISGCANSAPGSALGHPSLITQLCQLAGVDVHSPPFEGPGRAIDSRYIFAYCQDRAPPNVPAPEPIHAAGPQEDIPMDEAPAPGPSLTIHQRLDAMEGRMDAFMQRQEGRMDAFMQQQESLHRGQMFILDAFRSFSLHSAPGHQFPSTADYYAYTGWPGDQAPFFGGDGAPEDGGAANAVEEARAADDDQAP
uniref:Putative plant transposon protein domain-containing protein n=1 Tax=Cajanus cajan TaxID=3821 RepID=A0A151TWX9_CAJCA|nr:hypothetical protein KK1_010854 [Cajanus cajan]